MYPEQDKENQAYMEESFTALNIHVMNDSLFWSHQHKLPKRSQVYGLRICIGLVCVLSDRTDRSDRTRW